MAWLPFVFSVEEIGPSSRAPSQPARHAWRPPVRLGDNEIRGGPTHNKLYCCNGQIIREVHEADFGNSLDFHGAYSVYHHQQQIFVVDYDATRCAIGDGTSRGRRDPETWPGWQRLRFHYQTNGEGISCADIAGDQNRLNLQHAHQVWAHRLFPPDYQALQQGDTRPGGLVGPLPLLLALIVLAHPPQHSAWAINHLFQNGRWHLQNQQTIRAYWFGRDPTARDMLTTFAGHDLRGVLVHVWGWAPYTSKRDLESVGLGRRGALFQ